MISILLLMITYSGYAQKLTHTPKKEIVESYLRKGDSLQSIMKNRAGARVMYRKAIEIDSGYPLSYHKLGRSFLGDYFENGGPVEYLDSTIVYENKARMLDPRYVDAYWNEVLAYRSQLRHGMSRKVLMEALVHLPENPDILMLMGRNYFDTGNPGLALPYLEKSIEIGGKDAPGVAYRFAGWCWFYLENHEKQLEYFNRFRALDPESLMGIAGQVHSYTGLKDFKKATELAKQIKADNPDYDSPAYLEAYIGETLYFGEHFEEALPYYKKALQIDSTSQNLFATRAVTTTIGFLHLKRDNIELGEKFLQQTIERRIKEWQKMPERWEFSFDIASAYAAMGDIDNAYQWLYTSVLTGYPGHLWDRDPIFTNCRELLAFQELIKQARIRVISENQG